MFSIEKFNRKIFNGRGLFVIKKDKLSSDYCYCILFLFSLFFQFSFNLSLFLLALFVIITYLYLDQSMKCFFLEIIIRIVFTEPNLYES